MYKLSILEIVVCFLSAGYLGDMMFPGHSLPDLLGNVVAFALGAMGLMFTIFIVKNGGGWWQ